MPIKPSLESLCHGNVSWKHDNVTSQKHHDCSMICIATALQTYIYKIDLTFGENSKLVGKTNKIFLWLERYLKRLAPCLLCIFKKNFHPKVPQLTRIRCAKSSRLFFQNCPIFQYRILSKLYGNILSYNLLYTNTPTPQKRQKDKTVI